MDLKVKHLILSKAKSTLEEIDKLTIDKKTKKRFL